MRKDYKTIREVVGPLMMVEEVEGVKYDELVEIQQANGEIRSGKVLVIDGDKALVQLFESSQGLKISDAKARFLTIALQCKRTASSSSLDLINRCTPFSIIAQLIASVYTTCSLLLG